MGHCNMRDYFKFLFGSLGDEKKNRKKGKVWVGVIPILEETKNLIRPVSFV